MKKAILIIFVLIFLIGFVNAEEIDENALGIYCEGEIIELTESTNLIEDITNTCFEIKQHNIVLDCNNHKITGVDKKGYGIKVTYHTIPGQMVYPENVVIKNCVIENFKRGIIANQVGGEITGNILKNNWAGAFLIARENPEFKFKNNILTNNVKYGIEYGTGENVLIEGNIIENSETGINLGFCGDSNKDLKSLRLINNHLLNNKEGVVLSCMDKGPHTISENIIEKSERAIILNGAKNVKIENNNLDGADLWVLSSSRGIKGSSTTENVTITENTIINFSTVIGTSLKNSKLTNNVLQGGFAIHGAEGSLIDNNTIRARRGMEIGNNNEITNNLLERLDHYKNFAIQIVGNTNTIEYNEILGQFGWGVKIYGDSNTVRYNTIIETIWDEIYVEGNNNIISDNEIESYEEEISNSYIKNKGIEPVTFIPKITVQKKNEQGYWNDERIMYTGVSTVTLQPDEIFDFAENFNYYTERNTFNEPGEYRIHFWLTNQGEVLRNSEGEPLEIYEEFTVLDSQQRMVGGGLFTRIWSWLSNWLR